MAEEGKEIPQQNRAESDSKETKMSAPQTDNESQGDSNKIALKTDEPAVSVLSEVDASKDMAEEKTGIIPQEKADSALSPTDRETNSSHAEEAEHPIETLSSKDAGEESEGIPLQDAADGASEVNEMALAEESSSPEWGKTLNLDGSSLPLLASGSQGDDNKKSSKNNEPEIPGEDQAGLYKTPETTIRPTQEDRKDGSKVKLNEESPRSGGLEDVVNAFKTEKTKQEERVKPREEVTTVGSIAQEQTLPLVPEVAESPGGGRKYLVVVVVVVLFAILVQRIQPESPPPVRSTQHVEIFRQLLAKVKTRFPHQRNELWNRSGIHLQRHLQTAQPTEPVSLILTAGFRAQRTLRCLAQGLASAFSNTLNASAILIDGASVSSQDSDQVKLDIDSQLQGAFEGNSPAAVIHRFEELPPGSTLIFYRYCDHENAAYKKTFLVFTVLLGEEEEIPAKIHLSAVEEMVDDHLQKKFLSHDHPVSFDRMDRDKYGGLWSRISHLILPVASEERIEHEGCERT